MIRNENVKNNILKNVKNLDMGKIHKYYIIL